MPAGSSFASSMSLVRCLLLVHCMLVFARLLLTFEWPRILLFSWFGLESGGGGAPLGGSWLASESSSSSTSTSASSSKWNASNRAINAHSAPVEEYAVDLKTRFCVVALVSLPALVDAERGRVFKAFCVHLSLANYECSDFVQVYIYYTSTSMMDMRGIWHVYNIAPLLLLNWLFTASFATGFATLGPVLFELDPVPILTLVFLFFLPDTLYIPELLTSQGSFSYSFLLLYTSSPARSFILSEFLS